MGLDRLKIYFSTFVVSLGGFGAAIYAVVNRHVQTPVLARFVVVPLAFFLVIWLISISEILQVKRGDVSRFRLLLVFSGGMLSIVAGTLLLVTISAQGDLGEGSLLEDELGITSYQLGLFDGCCLSGSGEGLFLDCPESDKIARTGPVNSSCISNRDLYEDALANNATYCQVVNQHQLCDDAKTIDDFNLNMFLYTSKSFSIVAFSYIVFGGIVVMIDAYEFFRHMRDAEGSDTSSDVYDDLDENKLYAPEL